MKLKEIVISKTPHRIGLIGGGTDLPSFYKKYGGNAINFAINKFIYVTVKRHSHLYNEKVRINYSRTEICESIEKIENNIVRECLKYFSIDFPIYVETNSDIPSSSGLGSSSAFTVGLVNAISELQNLNLSKSEIAEISCGIEIDKVGSPIGKQDQYAAAFGGINLFSFEKNNQVKISPIFNTKLFQTAFIENSYILWTNIQRSANEVLADQNSNFKKNIHYYKELKSLCLDLFEILNNQDKDTEIDEFYSILNKAWHLKQNLSSKITNMQLLQIIKKILPCASHLKIAGAGGGGFIYMNLNTYGKDNFKEVLSKYNFEKLDICNRGTEIIYRG
jgi:D-glycero-alpha-D-manno-heptose-7-phosphate kinase